MPDFMTQAGWIPGVLLVWFAETTVVVSALATLAALASRVRWLTPGPAARHALWLMVMVKLVTPPLVHWPWSLPSRFGMIHRDPSRPWNPMAHITDPGLEGGIGADSGAERRRHAILIASTRPGGDAIAPATGVATQSDPPVPAPDPGFDEVRPTSLRELGAGIASAWLVGSVVLAVGQARRVCRFRRLLLGATPAPDWLAEEAERVGRRLGVDVPAILVVPRLGTPLLWCLGRPVMLVPGELLGTLKPDRWRAIVAHELAHLRRGDHWVRRLELAAGLVWWWNPLYWLARRRLDFEAELACDAWAIWASPDGRISYAESLIRICTTLSASGSPAPALGVAGNGRSFERRLRMILHDRVDRRVSVPSLLVASLMACLALPSWTKAGPPRTEDTPTAIVTTRIEPIRTEVRASVVATPIVATPVPTVVEVVESVSRDEAIDDEPDDDEAAAQKEKAKAKEAKLKAEKAELDAIREKKLAVAKEMEKKFGPGSEFARKMEAMGKEMEEKFGPNSEFARKMKSLDKEMQEKFGPDSEFAREMERKFGPDSDFARKMKEISKGEGQAGAGDEPRRAAAKAESAARAEAAKVRAEARAEAQKARAEAQKARLKEQTKARVEVRIKDQASPDQRARRIEALESRIEELMQELKRIKAEDKPEREDNR